MPSFLLQPGQEAPTVGPDHPFVSGAWRGEPFASWFAEFSPHAGDSVCSFRRVFRYTQYGVDHYQHTVHLRFAAQLETVAEVGLSFAMWVAKWSAHSECVGYYKGEDSPHPTLLYFHDGDLYLRQVVEPPQRATDGAVWPLPEGTKRGEQSNRKTQWPN